MTRICLNMIVKNESARIERCLASVAPYISCYAITDTGSTDDTIERIETFFDNWDIGIPGEVNHDVFINFEQARNEALDHAKSSDLVYDYLLLVDADMELVVDDPGVFERLSSAPAYTMLQRDEGLSYWNTRLVHRIVPARYIGVTHEYLDTGGVTPERLCGAWFKDHADGANRPGKVERDIALLEDDIRPKARSLYYLGQSLKESDKAEAAALAYRTRAALGGWDEEVWHAKLSAARCEAGRSERVSGLIEAFEGRPNRAEPLYDLARHYLDRGMNATAMIFAQAGLAIPKPDDILFVEDYPYDWGFKEQIGIAGFYIPAKKAGAHDLCEELSLSREAPVHTREQAWRNLFFYTSRLAEQAPSLRTRRIDFTPPDGYRPTNPSICLFNGRLVLNIRAVNYLIGQDGRYVMPPDNVIRTRNFLFSVRDDVTVDAYIELKLPLDLPTPVFNLCLGFEDLRLFTRGPFLWCSATTRQIDPDGWCEIVEAQISDSGQLFNWHVLRPEGPRRAEKNWMPIVGDSRRFIYSCDPIRVVDESGRTLFERPSPVAAAEWGGSSQAIPFTVFREGKIFRGGAGYLCLIHERQAYPDPMRGQRNYQRRFVWFDADMNIRRISRRFTFGDGEGEFVCGMCWHPDGKRLVISYGVLDREAWLATVDADEVRTMLREVGGGAADRSASAGGSDTSDRVDQPVASVIETVIDPWLDRNTNAVLRTEADLAYAIDAVKYNGWPEHPDRTKNWDLYVAVRHVLKHASRGDAILDAGADKISTFLPTLEHLGYERLTGINKTFPIYPEFVGGIMYRLDDISSTGYPDCTFAFIACLSTIEHGVDLRRFMREAARLLRPGGHLFISTDYWPDRIETGIRDWCIFEKEDIWQLIKVSSDEYSLKLTSQPSFDTADRVCRHAGLEYTFINLLFRKE